MSKIGRRPISLGGTKVEIKGQEIHYKGKLGSGVYTLPENLSVKLDGATKLLISPVNVTNDTNRIWGMHRALLSNAIKGVDAGFEKKVKINGLGFKAQVTGSKVVFTLGFSHKIDMDLPKGVTLDVDKSGQMLTFKSSDKAQLGLVCSSVRALRPPEPYKGTGVKLDAETIIRKSGKAKSA
ncbi:MAG: 50S ribosomal protein L6 [candidate division TM6 bacterium GW2011_GWF2_32_72]|nr:MAG: 50S ribosomal protein L6 [candidate division TM6 bacterium GW2011_GWF2_32_72]